MYYLYNIDLYQYLPLPQRFIWSVLSYTNNEIWCFTEDDEYELVKSQQSNMALLLYLTGVHC